MIQPREAKKNAITPQKSSFRRKTSMVERILESEQQQLCTRGKCVNMGLHEKTIDAIACDAC